MKISNVKRSQHIKHKKNYARPQKNAVKTKGKNATDKATAVSKKVFGKPVGQKSKKRDRGQEKKQLYTSTPAPAAEPVNGTNGDADEMDDDDVQDMLDMLHNDDENRDDFVSNVGIMKMSISLRMNPFRMRRRMEMRIMNVGKCQRNESETTTKKKMKRCHWNRSMRKMRERRQQPKNVPSICCPSKRKREKLSQDPPKLSSTRKFSSKMEMKKTMKMMKMPNKK